MLLNLGYGYGMKRICNHSTLRSNTMGPTVIFFFARWRHCSLFLPH